MVASGRARQRRCSARTPTAATSLAGLSPGLLAAFLVYFTLGFALYASMYAGAGSLLSRAEDLQMIALPLSIPAIMGYLPAVLALSGEHVGAFIRFASYVPLWSPFVMMSRLAIGRVEPWELVLSLGLLDRHGAAGRRSSRSASTGPACCSTASRRRCGTFVARASAG